jgi:hypothetical protein
MNRHTLKSLRATVTCLLLVAAFLPSVARAQGGPAQQVRPGGIAAATDTVAMFSGRAYGAQVKVLVPIPDTRLYADTGLLASAGGSISASLAAVTDAVFTSARRPELAGGSNLRQRGRDGQSVRIRRDRAALSCVSVGSSEGGV